MRRAWVLVLACVALRAEAQRKQRPPEVAVPQSVPMAAAPGAAVGLKFANVPAGDVVGVWTSFPAEFRDGKLNVGADAAVGVGAMRVLTREGVSGPMFFLVDDLPTVAREGENTAAGRAQRVPTLGAVEGVVEAMGSHFYRVAVKAGERVAFEVVANRVGSRMDPMVRISDGAGREVVYVDDTPGLGADLRFAHTFASEGEYVIEVRDANYEGGGDYRYRLRVGDFPAVTVAFPLAGVRGGESAFEFEGLPGAKVKLVGAGQRAAVGVKYPGGRSSAFFAVMMAEAPDVVAGGNLSLPTAAKIDLPAAVSGRFGEAGQRHYYSFEAKKGERVAVRGQTRSLYSACDLSIQCLKADGARVAASKSGEAKAGEPGRAAGAAPDEGTLDVTIPADGTYVVVVEDLNRAGGAGVVYRLTARRGGDFSLGVEEDTFNVAAGKSFKVKVKAVREGYNEAITLALTGDAAGWGVKNGVIGKGKVETELEVVVPEEAVGARRPICFSIVGNAEVGGKGVERKVGTVGAVKKVYPRMLYGAGEVEGVMAVGVRAGE